MRFIRSNGADGVESVSGVSTDSIIDSTCSGTSGTDSLTATNASFTAGQTIFIYQARGTGVGFGEFNQIESYVAGTITTVHPLERTYTNSGNSVAVVLVISKLSDFSNTSTFSAKDWTGSVGGLFIRTVSGRFYNAAGATINLRGKGYRGGGGVNQNADPSQGQCGEGTAGDRAYTTASNGNGGGGGKRTASGAGVNSGGGGGGGHATAGTSGINISGHPTGGTAGTAVGGTDFIVSGFFMGGGGGAAAGSNTSSFTGGTGGDGGAIFIVICDEFLNEGTIDLRGNDPDNSFHGGNQDGDAAPGAGGTLWVICKKYKNTGTITGVAGTYATGGTIGQCGTASTGRARVEACSIHPDTVNANPASTNDVGGHDFCGSVAQIIE